MEIIYHWTGFVVVWGAVLFVAAFILQFLWWKTSPKIKYFLKERTYAGQYLSYAKLKREVPEWSEHQVKMAYRRLIRISKNLEHNIYLPKIYALIWGHLKLDEDTGKWEI